MDDYDSGLEVEGGLAAKIRAHFGVEKTGEVLAKVVSHFHSLDSIKGFPDFFIMPQRITSSLSADHSFPRTPVGLVPSSLSTALVCLPPCPAHLFPVDVELTYRC